MQNEDTQVVEALCRDRKFLNAVAWRVGWRIGWRAALALLLPVLLLCLALQLIGCQHSATVTPRIVESPGASYDNGERTSGVLGFVDCGEGRRCVLTTPRFRARYNDLIRLYGRRFVPPIEKDYGVLDTGTNAFVFTKEAMQKSGEMHAWKASGL